jgi:mono/diheme cytochrome c family protein
MKKQIVILSIFAAGLFYACSGGLYEPSYSTVKEPGMANLGELKVGRELYISHCKQCHGLHKPNKYSAEKWVTILDKMQPKAKIDNEQRRLIYSYLINQN